MHVLLKYMVICAFENRHPFQFSWKHRLFYIRYIIYNISSQLETDSYFRKLRKKIIVQKLIYKGVNSMESYIW